MASSRHEPGYTTTAWVVAGCLWASLALTPAHAQEAGTDAPEGAAAVRKEVPITIDAESSEFDYQSNRLLFRGLRLDQGTLGIRADLAQTDRLDFEAGAWSFNGNVELEVNGAILVCDDAVLEFRDYNLASATLNGSPARFRQTTGVAGGNPAEGEAETIVYVPGGRLQFRENAFFSDGTNQISGALISYDLDARKISAGSGDSGPVTIVIPAPGPGQDTPGAGLPEPGAGTPEPAAP